MAQQFWLMKKLSILPTLFQPTYDALFVPNIPFTYRWRLLALQPLTLLAAALTSPTWLFTNRYSIYNVPTPGGPRRCLVFLPPCSKKSKTQGAGVATTEKKRPLHIDIHGGAFAGGMPEHNARWCAHLSDQTGAVVISLSYRLAPRYPYPAAHDDIISIVHHLLSPSGPNLPCRAETTFNIDPHLITIGGSSAGGNLALSTCLSLASTRTTTNIIPPVAYIGFYPALDLRLHPDDKPRPPNFPKQDPLAFLIPLYDAYAGPIRAANMESVRLNPILGARDVGGLPREVFVAVAGIDILVDEQMRFVEGVRARIGEDEGEEGEGNESMGCKRIEGRVWEKGFHGWLELPSFVLEKERMEVFDASVEVVRRAHRRGGWDVDVL
ncbi:alpha/beta-hydrolase [Amniculicola lignicola CBS 123094]|uniref:Alpha/beta-hydrolase n=1 Tax=Amniculicola lignicola CBS 123094 TaxID=1392246 RepID=A0A6A5X498_9PLEO|nr:alpha/beta-hydrolase [Amniculicola lignicola CBS 123094]